MCYAIPGKIVELKDNIAVVDYFGEKRNVLNEFTNVKLGDYIYAQGGIVVNTIPKKDALLILKDWEEVFFQLEDLDAKISDFKKDNLLNDEFGKIMKKALKKLPLKDNEILRLLKTDDENELNLLFSCANKFRRKHLKNSCCVHGIIEFSNYCENDCFYCGIRSNNSELKRYRMSVDEIVSVADNACNKLGFKALVLQSGEDLFYSDEKLAEIIKRIKEKCGVLLFMSIGSRSFETYKKMYDAGARGVLLRFETSNRILYKNIHPGGPKKDFEHRIELIKYAERLGYIVATGSIVGIPGQTEEDLTRDIALTKSLGAEMYSFGPLIPHPDTPFWKSKLTDIKNVLKVIAVGRLNDSNAKILVTTALETLDKKEGAKRGLLSGANSLMINVTPKKYSGLYSIYLNKARENKKVEDNINYVLDLLYSIGRAPTDLGM